MFSSIALIRQFFQFLQKAQCQTHQHNQNRITRNKTWVNLNRECRTDVSNFYYSLHCCSSFSNSIHLNLWTEGHGFIAKLSFVTSGMLNSFFKYAAAFNDDIKSRYWRNTCFVGRKSIRVQTVSDGYTRNLTFNCPNSKISHCWHLYEIPLDKWGQDGTCLHYDVSFTLFRAFLESVLWLSAISRRQTFSSTRTGLSLVLRK